MTEIKCPSCGGSKVEQVNAGKFKCQYCGSIFSAQGVDIGNKKPNITNDYHSTTHESTERKRNTFLSIALVVSMIYDSLCIIGNFGYMYEFSFVSLVLCGISLAGAIMMWQWKKLGFYLFIGINALSLLLFDDSVEIVLQLIIIGLVTASLFVPINQVRNWDIFDGSSKKTNDSIPTWLWYVIYAVAVILIKIFVRNLF